MGVAVISIFASFQWNLINIAQRQNEIQIDTSGWKTYRDEELGFEIKLPPNLEDRGYEGSKIHLYSDISYSGSDTFGTGSLFVYLEKTETSSLDLRKKHIIDNYNNAPINTFKNMNKMDFIIIKYSEAKKIRTFTPSWWAYYYNGSEEVIINFYPLRYDIYKTNAKNETYQNVMFYNVINNFKLL